MRGKALLDENELMEEGADRYEKEKKPLVRAGGAHADDDELTEGAPLTARDKRALVLLVVLCEWNRHSFVWDT